MLDNEAPGLTHLVVGAVSLYRSRFSKGHAEIVEALGMPVSSAVIEMNVVLIAERT